MLQCSRLLKLGAAKEVSEQLQSFSSLLLKVESWQPLLSTLFLGSLRSSQEVVCVPPSVVAIL